jgi:hypothetical protein
MPQPHPTANQQAAPTLTDIREIADLLAALPVFGADAAAELTSHLELHGLYRCASRVVGDRG